MGGVSTWAPDARPRAPARTGDRQRARAIRLRIPIGRRNNLQASERPRRRRGAVPPCDHILRPALATDATGAVVWAARYRPFGGIDAVAVDTGAVGQDIRFPGQWFQAETGLHQNWMRDYDPTTGRYLEADPLGLVDGASVYGYAKGNPLAWIDLTGTRCWKYSRGDGNTYIQCDGQSTYCPSGDCAARDPIENNTEFAQCKSECMDLLDLENLNEFRAGCMALGSTVGFVTELGRITGLPTGYLCATTYCEAKCRKQCGL